MWKMRSNEASVIKGFVQEGEIEDQVKLLLWNKIDCLSHKESRIAKNQLTFHDM